MTASGKTVVVATARGSGSDRVELADLQAPQALPNRVIDRDGQSPELSDGGKLLYAVPQYTEAGGDAGDKWYVTAPEPGAGKELALRARSSDAVGWAPGEAIGLLRKGSAKLVVRPGTRAERTIDSGFRRTRFGFDTSSRGDVRFFGPKGKIAIVRRDGARRVIDSPWEQLGAWSPDGGSLLVKRAYNQVSAIWEGSSTFRWQGSTHFQGNVGHVLWELRQKARTPSIKYAFNHERFCGRYPPCGCA